MQCFKSGRNLRRSVKPSCLVICSFNNQSLSLWRYLISTAEADVLGFDRHLIVKYHIPTICGFGRENPIYKPNVFGSVLYTHHMEHCQILLLSCAVHNTDSSYWKDGPLRSPSGSLHLPAVQDWVYVHWITAFHLSKLTSFSGYVYFKTAIHMKKSQW
jgi:hypothetical protein